MEKGDVMKKEVRFVLDVLQGIPADPAGIDWYYTLGFLELNKVGAVFFDRCGKLKIALPQIVERQLSSLKKAQALRNDYLLSAIKEAGAALENSGVKYAFLKGSVLSNSDFLTDVPQKTVGQSHKALSVIDGDGRPFYAEGERVSNDIDLLILPKDAGTVGKILKELGFVQGYYDFKKGAIVPLSRQEIISRRMNRGETAPFLREGAAPGAPFIEIDLNFSLDYLPTGQEALVRDMLDRTLQYHCRGGGTIRSLSREDFFFHLVMHQYKEMTLYSMVKRRKDLSLYKLFDLYEMRRRAFYRQDVFRALVDSCGLSKQTALVLSVTDRVFCRAEEVSGATSAAKNGDTCLPDGLSPWEDGTKTPFMPDGGIKIPENRIATGGEAETSERRFAAGGEAEMPATDRNAAEGKFDCYAVVDPENAFKKYLFTAPVEIRIGDFNAQTALVEAE